MIAGIQAEYQTDAGSTNDTPYLALTGELLGVFCDYFETIDCVITAVHCILKKVDCVLVGLLSIYNDVTTSNLQKYFKHLISATHYERLVMKSSR